MRIAVAIPTCGRPKILTETLQDIARQTRLPDVVCVAPSHVDDVEVCLSDGMPFPVKIVYGGKGSSAQRNVLLNILEEYDLVFFFDDDFLPHKMYIENTEAEFLTDPSLVLSTGVVLADGAKGPGIDPAMAREILTEATISPGSKTRELFSGYGCNIAARMQPVRDLNLRFNEEFPLYGWLEDLEFSRRLAPRGKIVQIPGAVGVHMAVKHARASGVRFGYSQVANPSSLVRDNVISLQRAIRIAGKNVLMNVLRSLWQEPYIDRRGRAFGNLLALKDLLRGQCHPKKILEL